MKGRLFAEGVSDGATVDASLVAGELALTRADAPPVRWRLDDLEVALGGTDDAHLVLSPRGAPRTQLYLERADVLPLLGEAPPDFAERVRGLVQRSRRGWVASRAMLLAVALALVVGVVALVASARTLALRAIPAEWEVAAGELAWESHRGEARLVDDPDLVGFVETTARRLLATRPEPAPYPFHFHVARDPAVNAFAFPGGHVVVNTGLIAGAGGPDEVAGVLAHELAHVLERHSLEQVLDQVGLLAALSLVLGDVSALAQLQGMLAAALELSFSRDHEREADAVGLRMMHAAGLDPRALARFFETLAKDDQLPGALSVLSTHPASAERSRALDALAAELPEVPRAPLVTPERWAELQAKAR